jgi:hypothetical protein
MEKDHWSGFSAGSVVQCIDHSIVQEIQAQKDAGDRPGLGGNRISC